MIKYVEWGIPGLDEVIGGLPENTVTLVYGPPKVGKSIFCYQFALHGLFNNETCLYLATDYGLDSLKRSMANFDWEMGDYINNGQLYLIDAVSELIEEASINNAGNYHISSVKNPTDIMVNMGMATKYLHHKGPNFRSVLDSLTSMFTYNEDMLIVRVLKAYIMRIKEAGGTSIVSYTEGSADSRTETYLKAMVDNIVRLDGKYITIEAIIGSKKFQASYQLTDNGLMVVGGKPL
ncbi:MAG TPA: RAD55 family ATPase [Methanobacteriaceae archaeon]|nr:RAD55 family ATPase [Methanobacteriaceae archaeon]